MKKPWNSCEIPMNPSFFPWITQWFFSGAPSWVCSYLNYIPWISHEFLPNWRFHCHEKTQDPMKYACLCFILISLAWKKKSLPWVYHDFRSNFSRPCHESGGNQKCHGLGSNSCPWMPTSLASSTLVFISWYQLSCAYLMNCKF